MGRLAGSRDWVLAWARSRRQAIAMVARDVGEIEPATILKVRGSGYFLFRARVSPRTGLEPSEGEYLMMYDEAADAWLAGHAELTGGGPRAASKPRSPRKRRPATRSSG